MVCMWKGVVIQNKKEIVIRTNVARSYVATFKCNFNAAETQENGVRKIV